MLNAGSTALDNTGQQFTGRKPGKSDRLPDTSLQSQAVFCNEQPASSSQRKAQFVQDTPELKAGARSTHAVLADFNPKSRLTSVPAGQVSRKNKTLSEGVDATTDDEKPAEFSLESTEMQIHPDRRSKASDEQRHIETKHLYRPRPADLLPKGKVTRPPSGPAKLNNIPDGDFPGKSDGLQKDMKLQKDMTASLQPAVISHSPPNSKMVPRPSPPRLLKQIERPKPTDVNKDHAGEKMPCLPVPLQSLREEFQDLSLATHLKHKQ